MPEAAKAPGRWLVHPAQQRMPEAAKAPGRWLVHPVQQLTNAGGGEGPGLLVGASRATALAHSSGPALAHSSGRSCSGLEVAVEPVEQAGHVIDPSIGSPGGEVDV
jgi:hypothetical protein